ncbi:hypothetical protein [Amnibacterium endophyticum]|uniref:SGNH hydrolase-type esterase domain-containing protein n=1 Tax=Amnibacterium endophyticum TaxID=2109337 RepID=A0ABW4LDA9_9MICO
MIPLLRAPVSRAALRALNPADRSVPEGEPLSEASGPDPDRVLVVGSGPVTGAGARRHDDALPGTIARALADRTGHGAVVEARGAQRLRLHDLPALLQGARLQRFDAMVLVIGLFDAMDGAGLRAWSRELHRQLDAMQRDGARGAVVLLTTVPPVSSVARRRTLAVALADRRVRRVNRVLSRAATDRPATGRVALPAPEADAPIASAAWYERCGTAVAEALAPLLAAQRQR